MKTIKTLSTAMVILFIAGLMNCAVAQTQHQFDVKGYTKIAKKSIGMIISGKVNPDTLIANMESLLKMGVAGCEEHMGEAETPAEEKKIMQAVIDDSARMKTLSLSDIEAQWHEGGALKAKGVDLGKYDHFSEVLCHVDAVVHPATAIICLNEYKKTKKTELLDQVKAELQEVVQHLKHLD